MKRGRKNKKLISLIMASAISFLSVYSLISFHQHKIFHKEFKYVYNSSLNKNEHDFDFLSQKNSNDNNAEQDFSLEIQ